MYLLCLLLLPLPALASPLNQDVTVFKSWLVTCLAVLLLGALAFLLTRRKALSFRSGEKIQIQSVLSLGMKEKLILVQVEEQRLLLGVTPQQIAVLANLTRGNPQALVDFAQLFNTVDTSSPDGEERK